jgi:hypothetical protein
MKKARSPVLGVETMKPPNAHSDERENVIHRLSSAVAAHAASPACKLEAAK